MDVDAAVHPLVNLDPAVLRAVRVPSRCTDCGRFGHLRGDPECPGVIPRTPRGQQTGKPPQAGIALPAPLVTSDGETGVVPPAEEPNMGTSVL